MAPPRSSIPFPKITLANTIWLAAYLLILAAIAGSLWLLRSRVVSHLDKDPQRARWQEFRQKEEAREASKQSPVQRRPPKSAEPPALVLLRDYFPVILAGSLVTGTVMFGFLAFVLRGIFSSSGQSQPVLLDEARDRAPVA